MHRHIRLPVVAFVLIVALGACSTAPKKQALPAESPKQAEAKTETSTEPKRSPYAPAQEDPSKRGDYVAGGLYAPQVKDSVPDYVPDVAAIPEPEVKTEARSRYGNRSYSVLGKAYRVLNSSEGYHEQGVASFYGKKFHGRLTSNQEVYDMNAYSAAHRSLPLPSYVRVTNLDNGKSVVLRVNDRGPFHSGRIIDLSYAAAVKLDFVRKGTARVEVRALQPEAGDRRRRASRQEERTRRDAAQPVVTVAAIPTTAPAPTDPALRAEEFDRWMRERGIRIASGKPGTSPATPASKNEPSIESSTESKTEPVTMASSADVNSVSLQVAAFSARENAERARLRLNDAGLPSLRIDEANVNGQPLWRLRIGPVAADRVAELSARCADLGFDAVQIIRE